MFPLNAAGPSYLDHFIVASQTVSAWFPDRVREPYFEARSLAYPTTHAFERSRTSGKNIQGGKNVQTSIDVVLKGDYGGYVGTEDWTFFSSNDVEFLTTHWRKEKGTAEIHEDELETELGSGVTMSAEGYSVALLNIEKTKLRRMMIDAAEKIENSWWAAPDPKMERAGADNPVRSIPYFVNEFVDGLAPGCTTQHGVTDPGQYEGPDGRKLLVCDQRRYMDIASNETGDDHIIEVLQEAVNQNTYGTIPHAADYSVTEEVLESTYFLATNQLGIT
ncbi:MAG: hypothetical protein AAFP22_04430, partial [Planctomycetota bacterium]